MSRRIGFSENIFIAARAHFSSLCGKPFQLKPEDNPEQFRTTVLIEVAQSLITFADSLAEYGRAIPDTQHLDRWINSPSFSQLQGNLAIAGFGGGVGGSTAVNLSRGFVDSGLQQQVLHWLQSAFPNHGDGGVICMIDNMELLQTSKNARRVLEDARHPFDA